MDDYERAARRVSLRLGVAAGCGRDLGAPRRVVAMVSGTAGAYHPDNPGTVLPNHQTDGSRQRSHTPQRPHETRAGVSHRPRRTRAQRSWRTGRRWPH